MNKSRRVVLCSVSLIIALLFSVFGPVTVFADDEIPTTEQTGDIISSPPTQAPDSQEDNGTSSSEIMEISDSQGEDNLTPEATDETAGDPQIQETPQATEETSDAETPQITPEATEETSDVLLVEPTTEPTPSFDPEALDTLPEILDAVPSDTEVVVLDNEGQPESMVSEEAAQTLLEGDPMWCPATASPGDAACTPSYGTFAELLSALAADAASGSPIYKGAGIIYVADSYNGSDDNPININGNTLTNISGSSLTILGGWDDGSGDAGTAGISVIDVSLTINNWLGNITVQDIFIDTTNPAAGLSIETQGNIVLDEVSVSKPFGIANASGTGANLVSAGNVGVYNGSFNYNAGNGLSIKSGGAVILDTINAWGNGLNGVKVNAEKDVAVGSSGLYSYFEGNGSNGLDIHSGGSISLTYINADGNYTGMDLNTTSGTGDIGLYEVYSSFNQGTGIHAESGGMFIADTINASINGANGLYVKSQGTIAIANSIFTDNINGTGATLNSDGDAIVVIGSQFYNNNIGLQTQITNGITLIAGVASHNNAAKGAYLKGSGESPIVITSSVFNENGDYGIYATIEKGSLLGDILSSLGGGEMPPIPEGTLPSDIGPDTSIGIAVLMSQANDNGIGAKLINKGAGLIGIGGSEFDSNDNAGLSIVTYSDVLLGGNFFTNNGANGVEVFSTYTSKSCYCPGDSKNSITVELIGGDFVGNGQWGLMVKPGPQGELILDETTPPIFSWNELGDYLLDTSDIPMCSNCDCVEKPEGKPYKIVDVPFSGGEQIPQECSIYAGTILQLPDGTNAKISCPFNGFSNLEGVNKEDLPGPLDGSSVFNLGMLLGLLDNDGSLLINADGRVTISFKIPENSTSRTFDILYWDPTLNEGNGGWFQLPSFEEGTNFPVGDDGRMIFSGVQTGDEYVSVTVNFAGYFILVSN